MGSVKRIAGRKDYPESERRKRMDLSVDDVIGGIALKSVRFGKKIQLQQLGGVPETPLERGLLGEIEAELQGTDKLKPRKLRRLESKAKVLRITSELRKTLGGRNPTVYQVLAVPAIRYGLDSEELDEISKSMTTTYCGYRSHVTWDGNTIQLRMAIRQGIPQKIETILLNSKNRSLNTNEIREGLSLKQNPYNDNLINVSCQLLETAGFIKKQPMQTIFEESVTDINRSVWSHRAYLNPFPEHENPQIYLLKKLFSDGSPKEMLTTELYGERHSRGQRYGSETEPYQQTTILRAIKDLRENGLVKTKTERIRRKRSANVLTEVSLTPYALKQLKRMYDNHAIPEELRKLLLGEKTMENPK